MNASKDIIYIDCGKLNFFFSSSSYCPSTPTTSYLFETGMIQGTFNFSDFFGDTNCSAAFAYYWVAASEAFGEKTFTLNFDMQSFAVAMAVNLGYLSGHSGDCADAV